MAALSNSLPVIDIFAGPGGLGEGFSSMRVSGQRRYRLALSIEKDPVACATLRTRAVRRLLEASGDLDPYFAWLRGEIERSDFESLPSVRRALEQASAEIMNAELGKARAHAIDDRIRHALRGSTDWVLIGGPPCQAYSLAGRARRANDLKFEADEKHFLYREYLRILRVHAPPVFVMENVKGLLSSHHGGRPMFSRIYNDLSRPTPGLEYEIRSFVRPSHSGQLRPDDFVIESERHGVPQARHRVILLGVRSDLANRSNSMLAEVLAPTTVSDVITDLPPIRSRLSRVQDGHEEWIRALAAAVERVRGGVVYREREIVGVMKAAVKSARSIDSVGSPFIRDQHLMTSDHPLVSWLSAPELGGVIQHETRGHMPSDLQRYLFASSFAHVFGMSPKLRFFPPDLLPEHGNADLANVMKAPFPDRFRVQCADLPSSTVVSHIAKDGHYYIHFDPKQCRSLTVREAARLQTFPDDYFFEGNRTQQYVQVGNAVPPYLAKQIAAIVLDVVSPRGR